MCSGDVSGTVELRVLAFGSASYFRDSKTSHSLFESNSLKYLLVEGFRRVHVAVIIEIVDVIVAKYRWWKTRSSFSLLFQCNWLLT